jgi:GNAT superfamily N-acetyltransferase
MAWQLEMHDRADSEEARFIRESLTQHNLPVYGPAERQDLVMTLKQDGKIGAGVCGFYAWSWLYIQLAWVREDLRGQGYGRKLMEAAEQAARQGGSTGIWIDTFDPHAEKFYGCLGFTKFGEIEDFPPGHVRRFLQKKF